MKKTLLVIALFLATTLVYAQENKETEKKCEKHCGQCFKHTPHHFTMTIGYGYMLSDSQNKDVFTLYQKDHHARHMHHGINYEFDYDYNFHKNMAFGFVASMYNAFDSFYKDANHDETFSDDRYIFYVGPSFLAHTDVIKEKWSLYARATFGFMNFRNAMRTQVPVTSATGATTMTSTSFTYKRATFGYGLEIGAEYILSRYISLDGQIHFMGGSIKKVSDSENKTELNEREDLSRLGIALGVKIKL